MRKLTPIQGKEVEIVNSFWSQRQVLVREKVIPYQWSMLTDRTASHTVENFRIAAGDSTGDFQGMVFQDSDLAKWLEAVGHNLLRRPNPKLEAQADEIIDLIERAQQPNGYVNTYFTIMKPGEQWCNLRDSHELYCAGHLIEAAVAYYRATGKSKIVDIVCRFVDHIDSIFGKTEEDMQGYPGHPEIELALVKLYRLTRNHRYLEISRSFVDERGRLPHYFTQEAERRGDKSRYNLAYSQSHIPVNKQQTAEGHAVRAMYLYSAMADLTAEYDDEALLGVCKALWLNVTQRRMYITGGVGSSEYEESFTTDYDLPNDRAYSETCAAIGLVFWAHRMLQIELNRIYADVMERAIYNTILSGMSLDGGKYFYVNPLEVWPNVSGCREDMTSVKSVRQPWFSCACCPPNLARFISSVQDYLYSADHDGIYIHLYTGSKVGVELENGRVELRLETRYPWDGQIDITIETTAAFLFNLYLRIPQWCRTATVKVNDTIVFPSDVECINGYIKLEKTWRPGDCVTVNLSMPVERIRSHVKLHYNTGRVALMRGPVVYCIEEVDNGENLPAIILPPNTEMYVHEEDEFIDGIPYVTTSGLKETTPSEQIDDLYWSGEIKRERVEVKAVPYFSWCNRKPGEMLVWIREEQLDYTAMEIDAMKKV